MPAKKITEKVYLVGDLNMTHPWDCAVYLVLGRKPVLIDCGCGKGHEKLKSNLAGLGVRVKDIACVIGTHGHYDHVGGIERLRGENPRIRLALHAKDADQIEKGDRDRTCAGWMYGAEISPQRVDARFGMRKTLTVGGQRFEIIHAPGHTPGSICVRAEVNGKKALFVGDSLNPGNAKAGSEYHDWEETLEKLREVEFDILLPGHGGLWFLNPFLVLLKQPFSRTGGKKAYGRIQRYFRDPFWTLSTIQYSFVTPVAARIAGRMFKRSATD